ncbi:hypothetical protein ABT299_48790 [Spirillospora sp. NPDC000708]
MVTSQELGPDYGYTVDGRPLRNERDWAAEQIRIILRRAGCSPAGAGCAVNGQDPYLVSVFAVADRLPDVLADAAAALISAGYLVELIGYHDETLRVWPPADQIPVVAVARGMARHCRWCGEAMMAVEAAASVAHDWSGRCANCQAEHLAQLTTTSHPTTASPTSRASTQPMTNSSSFADATERPIDREVEGVLRGFSAFAVDVTRRSCAVQGARDTPGPWRSSGVS